MGDSLEECEYEESYDSLIETEKSCLSMFWRNGLWLGKKVLVIGVVISLAPLVFPLLIVASFLGFSVWVPAGVFLASYTFTETLMNKLLVTYPSSSSTVLEEEGEDEKVQGVDIIKVYDEQEQDGGSVEEVAMAIEYIEEPEQYGGSVEEGSMAIEDIEEPEQDGGSVEEVATAIEDIEEPEQDGGSVEEGLMAIEDIEEPEQDSGSVEEGSMTIEDIEEPEQDSGSVEEVTMAEKGQEEVVSDDLLVEIIKDIEEPKQDGGSVKEVPMAIKGIEEPEQDGGSLEEAAMVEKRQEPIQDGGSVEEVAMAIEEDIEAPGQDVGSVQEVAMLEKGHEVESADDLRVDCIKDIEEELEQDGGRMEVVAMAEKGKEVVSHVDSIKDIEVLEQDGDRMEEVPMVEKGLEVVPIDSLVDSIKDIEEPDQIGVCVEEVVMSIKDIEELPQEVVSVVEVVIYIKDIEEPKQEVSSVEEIAMAYKGPEVISADLYVDSIKDSADLRVDSIKDSADLRVDSIKDSADLRVDSIKDSEEPEQDDGRVEDVAMVENRQEGVSTDLHIDSIKDSEKPKPNRNGDSVEEVATVEKDANKVVSADFLADSIKDGDEPAMIIDTKSYTHGGINEYNVENTISSDEKSHLGGGLDKKESSNKETVSSIETKELVVIVVQEPQDTSRNTSQVKILDEFETTIAAVKKKKKKIDDDDDESKHKSSKKKKSNSFSKTSHGLEDKQTGKVPVEVKAHEKQKTVDHKGLKTDHYGLKGDKSKTSVHSVVPTVEMKSVILESNSRDSKRAINPNTKPKGNTKGNLDDVDKKRAELASGAHKDHRVGDKAVVLKEKKLWDQIDGLRLIVGYKTTKRSSLIEELKALYAFTGVKPPSPFKNSDDISGTEEKLHFLMSIVGVK